MKIQYYLAKELFLQSLFKTKPKLTNKTLEECCSHAPLLTDNRLLVNFKLIKILDLHTTTRLKTFASALEKIEFESLRVKAIQYTITKSNVA